MTNEELLALLDQSIEDLTLAIDAADPALTVEQLRTLRAAEEGGKTRVGAFAAIDAAIAALEPANGMPGGAPGNANGPADDPRNPPAVPHAPGRPSRRPEAFPS
jgi:hypothetical protein